MDAKIVVLPGDGIGEEIVKETHKVLKKIEEKFLSQLHLSIR